MKSVGVKNLKNQLSRYLKLVREGESVYVTDRDEVIAEIHRPTRPLKGHVSQWEAFLNEQEEQGALVRAQRTESTVLADLKKEAPWPKGSSTDALLDEIRSDRF